jgi:hypothetical protein
MEESNFSIYSDTTPAIGYFCSKNVSLEDNYENLDVAGRHAGGSSRWRSGFGLACQG